MALWPLQVMDMGWTITKTTLKLFNICGSKMGVKDVYPERNLPFFFFFFNMLFSIYVLLEHMQRSMWVGP